MQDNKMMYIKKHILIIYVFCFSLFCTNSIVFSEGLTIGFVAGVVHFIPSIWIYVICFFISILKLQTGECISYIISLGFLCLLSHIARRFPRNNVYINILFYILSYIPAFFVFEITIYYQFFNLFIAVAMGHISYQIASKFASTNDLSFLFLNCFPNCFLLFIIGISSPTITFWKIEAYHVMFAFLALTCADLCDDKTYILSMIFYAFAGYVCGIEYSITMLLVGVFIAMSTVEWGDFIAFFIYLSLMFVVSLFISNINFNFTNFIISNTIGGVLFLITPHKKIKEITEKGKYATQKEIINRDRNKIAIKIDELARCFQQIATSYNKIAESSYKDSDGIKFIASETIRNVCTACNKYESCNKRKLERQAEFEFLAHCAITKNKATILDFGDFISKACSKKVAALNSINETANYAKNQIIRLEEKGKSKEEVARTYARVSTVLHKLSKDASKKISFDINAQIKISEILDQSSIYYKELFIYQNDNKCVCVEMFASSDDVDEILSCINEVFTENFYLAHSSKQENSAFAYMIFAMSPNITISHGHATKSKKNGEPNGDSCTIMNLSSGRFVCAICDGMGSGQDAHDFSQKAINFIENLFIAGFMASDIIANVNSFMESCEYNSYATLDILELDLYKEEGYLYKVGSPDTYYHSEKTFVYSSKALPIGIMKELNLEINTFKLSAGDKIILSSDGILDYMRGEIIGGVSSKNWINSQIFSSEIMQGCDKKMKHGNADDRTIIAVEICKNT